MNFVLMAPGRKTREGVPSSPQWDGFLKVLSTSDLKFLSLDGVENQDKMELKGSSQEKSRKI